MLKPDDLPTDPADRDQDAEDFVTNEDIEIADFVIIIGQLDPTEVSPTGQARWTEGQRALILKAQELLDTWRD